jgi:hypothetical protein
MYLSLSDTRIVLLSIAAAVVAAVVAATSFFKPIQTVGGGDMIDGWEAAIKTMRIGERAVVRINDPNLGYGAAGFAPIIPPNAEIELDLEILDAKARSSIDFDTLAIGDPDTPVRSKRKIGSEPSYPKLMCLGLRHIIVVGRHASNLITNAVAPYLTANSRVHCCSL